MADRHTFDLSTPNLAYILGTDSGLSITRYSLPSDAPWAEAASPAFAVYLDGQRVDGRADGVAVREITVADLTGGARHTVAHLTYAPGQLAIEHHTVVYPDSALAETWQIVRNVGDAPARITRLDSIALDLPAGEYELLYFTGAWGLEFESVREPLAGERALETRAGRSSQGQHPWFTLFRRGGGMLSGAIAWSGNWVFRFEPHDGGYRLSGGLHDWAFYADLAPGAQIESPRVALALAAGDDLNHISQQYARIGRKHWYPQSALARSLPPEWNHWWPYEDREIDEATFRANADVAGRMGVAVCTLDAGWFGPTDPATHWYDYRGDWDQVNTARFPSGIRALSDYVHTRGMWFGLWCEIEALGQYARLAESHPALVAQRAGERLGYVCFGNPAAQEWAFATLDRLIVEYGCDWLKLDFNLDPGAGCDRTDHGHGAGDGLYTHYMGYYRVLERLRQRYPEVVLESCSSGGLRIDLGLLRQTHMTFLSDPDWPEHDLQLFWGASAMLAPEVCLHWGWSEWRTTHRYQTFNPRDPSLTPQQLDFAIRVAMLGMFGFSQRLPELPAWVARRFAEHIALYRSQIGRFVAEADVYRLTEQPRREGRGDRWAAFQYGLPDGSEHLLFVFRLHGAAPERTLYLRDLDGERDYTLTWLMDERRERRRGADLMQQGITIDTLQEEESAIVHIA